MMLLYSCASRLQDTLMLQEETRGLAIKLVVKDSMTRHLAEKFSHSTCGISNLLSAAAS